MFIIIPFAELLSSLFEMKIPGIESTIDVSVPGTSDLDVAGESSSKRAAGI